MCALGTWLRHCSFAQPLGAWASRPQPFCIISDSLYRFMRFCHWISLITFHRFAYFLRISYNRLCVNNLTYLSLTRQNINNISYLQTFWEKSAILCANTTRIFILRRSNNHPPTPNRRMNEGWTKVDRRMIGAECDYIFSKGIDYFQYEHRFIVML